MTSEKPPPGNAPLISVIITNHNYANFLETCIRSALSQDYPSVEVIVVDDGSTDNSRSIIESFDSISAVYVANSGQAGAVRAGLAISAGEIVYCLDSDDFLYVDALSSIQALWTPDVSAVAARLSVVRGLDNSPTSETIPERYNPESNTLDFMIRNGYVEAATTSGMAFSRALALKLSAEALNMTWNGIDAYLTYSAPLFGRLIQSEKLVGCYRIHGQNVSLAATKTIAGLQAHVYYQYWAQMTFRKFALEMKGLSIAGPPKGAFLLQWLIMTADFPSDRFVVPMVADIKLAFSCAQAFLVERSISRLHRIRNAGFIILYSLVPQRLRQMISRAIYA